MVTSTKPPYGCNDDFVTDFETEEGPGFFPGAGGYFHGCSATTCSGHIVFFGTDFGLEQDWKEKVQGKGCEKRSQPTLRTLRSLIDDVRDETGIGNLACWCYLTNAVLALAKTTKEVNSSKETYKAYKKWKHRSYLQKCREAHLRLLREQEPGLAVLLGTKHLDIYRRDIWRHVWPELFGPDRDWGRIATKEALDNPVRTTESGLRVQLMYHPSSGQHWYKRREQAKEALAREVRRLAESRAPAGRGRR